LNWAIRYLQWKTGASSDLSNSEIQILLDEGTIEKINIGAITNPGEYQNEQTKQKGVEERQKIIDSQVDLITKDLI
jgi:hypothetical protein